MKSKKILIALLFLCIANIAGAQFLNIGGITVQATSKSYTDGDNQKSETCDQLYNISFKDMILAHNIYVDGTLDVSQLYQLNSIERYMDGNVTVLKYSALSGRSGMVYKYETRIDADGKLMSMVCTEESGYKTTFKGGISELKTFKQ